VLQIAVKHHNGIAPTVLNSGNEYELMTEAAGHYQHFDAGISVANVSQDRFGSVTRGVHNVKDAT